MAAQNATVLERIAQNVLATIGSVTLSMPDGSAPALTITRAAAKNNAAHLTGFIFQNSPDRIEDAPAMTEEWVQQFAVVVYVVPLETDQTPVDAYNNAVIGAIHKALMVDYGRGGLAVNTIIQAPLFFPPVAGEVDGITFNFDVQYRNVLDDPFTPAG